MGSKRWSCRWMVGGVMQGGCTDVVVSRRCSIVHLMRLLPFDIPRDGRRIIQPSYMRFESLRVHGFHILRKFHRLSMRMPISVGMAMVVAVTTHGSADRVIADAPATPAPTANAEAPPSTVPLFHWQYPIHVSLARLSHPRLQLNYEAPTPRRRPVGIYGLELCSSARWGTARSWFFAADGRGGGSSTAALERPTWVASGRCWDGWRRWVSCINGREHRGMKQLSTDF